MIRGPDASTNRMDLDGAIVAPADGLGSPEYGLLAGCVLGMVVAAAGSWLRFALERTLRIDTHTGAFLVATAVSGSGLIVTGICSLRLSRIAGRIPWRTLWRWAVAVQVCGFLALALTSTDLFMTLCTGALSLTGLSPYTTTPVALGASPFVAPVATEPWMHAYSPYGPLFHRIVAAVAAIGLHSGSPVWVGTWTFKALMLVAVLLALAIAARHLRRTGSVAAAEIFAVIALGPLVAWEVPGQGHNDGLLLLFLVAFVAAAARDRPFLATAAVAAASSIKWPIAPLLCLYLIVVGRSSWRRAALLALMSAGIFLAAGAPEWRSINLRAVYAVLGADPRRHAHSLIDLVALVLDRLGQPSATSLAVRVLSTASMLLCLAVLARTAVRARSLVDLGRGYLLFLLALYLTAPWFQPWYTCWALPFLLVEPDPRWRRFVALYVVLTVVQWVAPLDPVTTVAVDLWAAMRVWKLLEGERDAEPLDDLAEVDVAVSGAP